MADLGRVKRVCGSLVVNRAGWGAGGLQVTLTSPQTRIDAPKAYLSHVESHCASGDLGLQGQSV